LPVPKFLPAAKVDANFAKEDEFLKFLVDDFFAKNTGSRFISNAALKQMTAPSTGFTLSTDNLRAALKDITQSWDKHTFRLDPVRSSKFTKEGWTEDLLPPFVRVDGRYLSMAETFQVLTDVFAEFDRTGKLPKSVPVVPVYGPLETQKEVGPKLENVTIASIAHLSASIGGRLHDNSWSQIPKNMIPSRVTLNGAEINAAQFLRLMADALVNPSPEAKLTVKETQMISELGVA